MFNITGYEFAVVVLGIIIYLISSAFLLILITGMLLAILEKLGVRQIKRNGELDKGTPFLCILFSIFCVVIITIFVVSTI